MTDDTENTTDAAPAGEGTHAARARGSRRGRNKPVDAPPQEAAADSPAGAGEQAPADAAGDDAEPGGPNRLDRAVQKLARMKETNSICFRHRNDFARIEQELGKFNYSDAELEMILEPKGRDGIPGFSWNQMERQKQYVRFLGGNPDGPGHAPG